MRSPPAYMSSRDIKLKIKVLNQEGRVLQKGKISVDRDTITFDKLHQHLMQTFRIKSPAFLMMYHVPNASGEGTLAMVDDWDLDAALQQFRHSMKITIQTNNLDELAECNHETSSGWDVVAQQVPKVSTTPAGSEHNTVTGSDNQTSNSKAPLERKSSFLDRVLVKLQEFVFQDAKKGENEVKYNIPKPSKSPMTLREFQNYLDADGRLVNYQAFRESVFYGGVTPNLRKIAWRHLLCVFPEGMTGKERIEYLAKRSQEYKILRDEWKTEYINSEGFLTEEMRFVTSMVKKDVIRADRTHPYYKGREDNKHTLMLFDLLCTYSINHPDVSYCQGMCDLASPLLIIQDNEAHAYLLFCAMMERMKYNFSHDGKAMSTKFEHLTQLLMHFDPEFYAYMQDNQVDDLLFTYRWLLLEMKREFPADDSLHFTEVMWSTLPTMPSEREIPFSQPKNNDNQDNNSPPKYTHLTEKLDPVTEESDFGSPNSREDSMMSYYPECEPISRDQSFVDKTECLERALMQAETDDADDFAEREMRDRSPSFVSNATSCQCEDDTESRRSSVFYLDLDGNEVIPACQCNHSVDSGFLSRPESPHNLTSLHYTFEDSTEEQPQLFAPPKEFGFGNPFLQFAALAMILQQRDRIMEQQMDFNDILMLFNNFKCQHNVKTVLKEARQLYEAYINNELHPNSDEFVHINFSTSS